MTVHRTGLILRPDATRVCFRPFQIHDRERIRRIVDRVMALDETTAEAECQAVLAAFASRHNRLRPYLLERCDQLRDHLASDAAVSEARQLLLGAYFTQEYSLEAAALFNPSIVPHPDQGGVPPGSLRFVLSLRAVGEGHLSSIVFRTGLIGPDGEISVDEPGRFVAAGTVSPNPSYRKAVFERKLVELGQQDEFARAVLAGLATTFTQDELEQAIRREAAARHEPPPSASAMRAVARANYEISFAPTSPYSERVILPVSAAESRGIEDARFVRFQDERGAVTYYGTYTAYDGQVALPQVLETHDFLRFRISTLHGPAVRNKGFALFPRRIRGRYAMLSRQDNENLYLMYSDSPYFWHDRQLLLRPAEPWEFVQLGNCGSPLETDAGWLVLTHGVGPMRRYTLGAILLDRDDPTRVLGRLRRPLLEPDEAEREGYVPNVVYSCGALVHGGRLILPYAMSDQCASFATVPLEELLHELTLTSRP